MPEIPECLNRRYKVLDELIQELSALSPSQLSQKECFGDNTSDPGIKLMCDFWKILKEDPNCNLSQAVKQRMDVQETASSSFEQRVSCYMIGKHCKGGCSDNERATREAMKKIRCIDFDVKPSKKSSHCCNSDECRRPSTSKSRHSLKPLSKALCNLQEAASFEKNCNDRVKELMQAQDELKTQIQSLEQREKEGVQRLKEADRMWSSMEETYKKKITESFDRQKDLLTQLQEVEKSNNKWRKNMKDLERQTKNINECQQEIAERMNQKNNDIKCLEAEIENFKKRIQSNKLYTDGTKKLLNDKKQASENKMAAITVEIAKIKTTLKDVQTKKNEKQKDGQQYVKEARDDLQKICRALLQKKLENEDLTAEKQGLEEELIFLKQSYDLCKEKCKNKQDHMVKEIKVLDKEIEENKAACKRCHQGVDTADARRLCNDCSRCKEDRECKIEGDQCERDPDMDCVCIGVKEKFLCNVFDNMYTVLEENSKSAEGKSIADAILSGLQKSKNGKLTPKVKQRVHDFVMKTFKKNINLTVVGGAVKTRCEMEPETFQQLMCCLKYVKEKKLSKADKGTEAMKASCRRWDTSNECNCPGGVNACSCTKKVPPRKPRQSKENMNVPKPNTASKECFDKKESSCGPDCAMHAVPSIVGTEVSKSKPASAALSCPFSNNMRAAQCVLGPESLSCQPKTYVSSTSYNSEARNKTNCSCGKPRNKSSVSKRDQASRPRSKIIDEVMGRNTEVAPIQKVSYTMIRDFCDEYL